MSDTQKRKDKMLVSALQRIGREGKPIIREFIKSNQLRNSLSFRVNKKENVLTFFNPEYWANVYHNGRGDVASFTDTVLVYFRDPANDPRIGSGKYGRHGPYPVTESSVTKLSKEDFDKGLRINRELWEQSGRSPDATMEYMVVVKIVGPADGNPYFDKAKPSIRKISKRILKEEGIEFTKQEIRRTLKKVKGKLKADIKFTF